MSSAGTQHLDAEDQIRRTAAEWLELRLTPDDLVQLSHQGFVGSSVLPSGAKCFKLRFRNADGRQRVVYLGVDSSLARGVARELVRRQSAIRRRRHLNQLIRAARRRFAIASGASNRCWLHPAGDFMGGHYGPRPQSPAPITDQNCFMT